MCTKTMIGRVICDCSIFPTVGYFEIEIEEKEFSFVLIQTVEEAAIGMHARRFLYIVPEMQRV